MAIRMLAPRLKGKGLELVLTQTTAGTYEPVADNCPADPVYVPAASGVVHAGSV